MTNLYFDRADGRIAYFDEGAGPFVLMVPGIGDLKEEYRHLVSATLAAGDRVVTMDLRGIGGSSTGWPASTNAAIGGDIVALVRHLGATDATIVGTSMGAGAAVWAAAEAPDCVTDLVLIGPFVRAPANASTLTGTAQRLAQRRAVHRLGQP